jgi:hypothetical protein
MTTLAHRLNELHRHTRFESAPLVVPAKGV